jgi:hypothetical protein
MVIAILSVFPAFIAAVPFSEPICDDYYHTVMETGCMELTLYPNETLYAIVFIGGWLILTCLLTYAAVRQARRGLLTG